MLGARRLAATLGLTPGLEADLVHEAPPPEFVDEARAVNLSTRFRRTVAELLLASRTVTSHQTWAHCP